MIRINHIRRLCGREGRELRVTGNPESLRQEFGHNEAWEKRTEGPEGRAKSFENLQEGNVGDIAAKMEKSFGEGAAARGKRLTDAEQTAKKLRESSVDKTAVNAEVAVAELATPGSIGLLLPQGESASNAGADQIAKTEKQSKDRKQEVAKATVNEQVNKLA